MLVRPDTLSYSLLCCGGCGGGGARALNLIGKRYERANTDSLEADVRMQMRAKAYATAFNELAPPKPVDFIQCWMLHLRGRTGPEAAFATEVIIGV